MNTDSRLLPVVAITGSSILVGCGGYSGGSCGSYGSYGSYGSVGAARTHAHAAHAASTASTTPTAPTGSSNAGCGAPINVGADGIYEGTLTNKATLQENPVVAIIADNGDGRMSGQDGTYYRLNVNTSGNNVAGSFSGYSKDASFPNGGQSTSGSLSAVITLPGLNGALTDQAGDVEALSLNFDNVYNLPSALPTLVGTWNYGANGFSLTATIQADGVFSAIDSNGCSYTGAFGLIDANFNAYSESYIRSCKGSSMTFTGLASYFPAASIAPAEIKLLADDNAGDYLVADLK
jgi:hypothetical protein